MLFNVIIKTEGVVMERSIEIVNLVKEKLNEYVEELKKQNIELQKVFEEAVKKIQINVTAPTKPKTKAPA